MEFSDIKAGMTLHSTNSTTYVLVTEVEKYSFRAKEMGNGCGVYETQKEGRYWKISVDCGSWETK